MVNHPANPNTTQHNVQECALSLIGLSGRSFLSGHSTWSPRGGQEGYKILITVIPPKLIVHISHRVVVARGIPRCHDLRVGGSVAAVLVCVDEVEQLVRLVVAVAARGVVVNGAPFVALRLVAHIVRARIRWPLRRREAARYDLGMQHALQCRVDGPEGRIRWRRG